MINSGPARQGHDNTVNSTTRSKLIVNNKFCTKVFVEYLEHVQKNDIVLWLIMWKFKFIHNNKQCILRLVFLVEKNSLTRSITKSCLMHFDFLFVAFWLTVSCIVQFNCVFFPFIYVAVVGLPVRSATQNQ